MAQTEKVSYSRGFDDVHFLETNSAVLGTMKLDYEPIPEDQRGGTSVKMVASAALYCFCSTLAGALKARAAEWKNISGTAIATIGKDENMKGKILSIAIEVELEISDEFEDIVERCKKIMKQGCLITATLEGSMDISYVINAKYIEE